MSVLQRFGVRVLFAGLCLATAFICLVFDYLFGAEGLTPIYWLILAAFATPTSLLLISIQRRKYSIGFLCTVTILAVAPFIPWTPEKYFAMQTKRVRVGMTLDEVNSILGRYRLHRSWQDDDGSRNYEYASNGAWSDLVLYVTVMNGRVSSCELDVDD